MAGWEISCTWKIMEVHSWENHRTKWVVVQQAIVDCRRVYSFIAMILDKPYISIPGSNQKRTTVMSGELPMVQLLHDSSGWKKTGFQAFQLTAGLIETDGRLGWDGVGHLWEWGFHPECWKRWQTFNHWRHIKAHVYGQSGIILRGVGER